MKPKETQLSVITGLAKCKHLHASNHSLTWFHSVRVPTFRPSLIQNSKGRSDIQRLYARRMKCEPLGLYDSYDTEPRAMSVFCQLLDIAL
jgi:hypothetical protein